MVRTVTPRRSSFLSPTTSTAICNLFLIFLPIYSFAWTTTTLSRSRIVLLPLKGKKEDELLRKDDWREFRAKLVQQQNGGASTSSSFSSSSSSWAYEAGTLIEKGSIVLGRVEAELGCHDLRQPYFHKCAVLILEHDDSTSTCTTTRGIILNRPSSLVCTDGDISMLLQDEEEENSNLFAIAAPHQTNNAWRMNFGGDIGGLFSETPTIVTLHSSSGATSSREGFGEEILPNLWVTSHRGARSLVALGEATCQDFDTFYGVCSWEQGMLQREVDRGSWYIVSMDSQSILDSVRHLRQDNTNNNNQQIPALEGGIQLWEDWTRRIHKEDEERVEESRGSFSDLMLKEWCHEMLYMPDNGPGVDTGDGDGDGDDKDYTFNMFTAMENVDDDKLVGPGSLVQASSDPSTYMLFDQLFHKSTILLLEEETDFSLGLILNLPTIDSYEHELPNSTKVFIPIRYGGPSGHYDDDDDAGDEKDIIWLHNSAKLRDMGVGQFLSETSSCWTCSQIEALNSIDLGLAKACDFLAVQGHVIWEKELGVGGVAGQIASGALRAVHIDRVDNIWTVLGNQSPLNYLDGVQSIFACTQEAWKLGQAETENDNNDEERDAPRCVHGTSVTLPDFADEALRKWIEIFLWGNREYEPC